MNKGTVAKDVFERVLYRVSYFPIPIVREKAGLPDYFLKRYTRVLDIKKEFWMS